MEKSRKLSGKIKKKSKSRLLMRNLSNYNLGKISPINSSITPAFIATKTHLFQSTTKNKDSKGFSFDIEPTLLDHMERNKRQRNEKIKCYISNQDNTVYEKIQKYVRSSNTIKNNTITKASASQMISHFDQINKRRSKGNSALQNGNLTDININKNQYLDSEDGDEDDMEVGDSKDGVMSKDLNIGSMLNNSKNNIGGTSRRKKSMCIYEGSKLMKRSSGLNKTHDYKQILY